MAASSVVKPEETPVRPFVVQPGQHEINAQAGELQTQVLASDRFERVGLVENRHVVFGQQSESRRPQRQIGDEQRVVDDQDIRILSSPPCSIKKAVFIRRTLATQTIAILALHSFPNEGSGRKFRSERLPSEVLFDHMRTVASWSCSSGRSKMASWRWIARSIAAD